MKTFAMWLAVAVTASCLTLGTDEGAFSQSISVSGPVSLDVVSNVGGIIVTPGSSNVVRIHAVLRAQHGWADMGRAQDNIRELERNPPIEHSGDRIRIGYVRDQDLLKGVSMRLEIEAPRHTKIDAHASSGGIHIRGVDGPVVAQTSSGRLELSDIGGEVHANASSGGITVQKANGSVSAQNSSGGITIADVGGSVESETTSGRLEVTNVKGEVRASTSSGGIRIERTGGGISAQNSSGGIEAADIAGAIEAHTSSGAIHLEQTKPASVRAQTSSGAVLLKLASGSGYEVEANSSSGRISVPEIRTSGEMRNHHVEGRIGEGGPLVSLTTSSGGITVN